MLALNPYYSSSSFHPPTPPLSTLSSSQISRHSTSSSFPPFLNRKNCYTRTNIIPLLAAASTERFGGGRGGAKEKDNDKDPEFAEILGSCLDDPEKARSKMEERLRQKKNKILHIKTGSAKPMKVTFNKKQGFVTDKLIEILGLNTLMSLKKWYYE